HAPAATAVGGWRGRRGCRAACGPWRMPMQGMVARIPFCRAATGAAMVANPLVGIVMGSRSDWDTMQHAAARLEQLGIAHEVRVVSAHRTPDVLFEYAASAGGRGLRAIIAGAGGAAHLPGMLASKTELPVL